MVATAYTDGGSRRKEGAIGVSLCTRDDREVIAMSGFIGRATSNQAEYQALIWACRLARQLEVRDLQIYSDSQLVVSQMNGHWSVKSHELLALLREARKLARFARFRITHIPRLLNQRADDLVDVGFQRRRFELDFSGVIPDGD